MNNRVFPPAAALLFLFSACSLPEAQKTIGEMPEIFPDYAAVSIPYNIAPLNFQVKEARKVRADFLAEDGRTLFSVCGKSVVRIPEPEWKAALEEMRGRDIRVEVSAWNDRFPEGARYRAFAFHVSERAITPYIAYRLIEPGYVLWNEMGIYQRDLASFREKAIVTNRQNHHGCVNCHSFLNYSGENFLFHARGKNGGTVIVRDGKPQKVEINQLPPKKNATYPMWHPSGRYIAFSSNDTHQSFFHYGKKAAEVYDLSSDLIIYDVERQRVLTDERFSGTGRLETFPAFSPDGKYLYFCSAEYRKMPMERKELKYALLRVPFREDGTLGEPVDTLYNPRTRGGSCSFPRLSPDGNYLMYTETADGTFPIWHPEADLRLLRLSDLAEIDVQTLNSPQAESYHSWSADGRWIVFGSRRLDGRYTRLFFAEQQDDGTFGKPFLLPQENPEQNTTRLKSYNIPEFASEEVRAEKETIANLFEE